MRKRDLERVLLFITGKDMRKLDKSSAQLERSLWVYFQRGEFNPNLDGEELYQNAKECLERACYEFED